MNDKKKNKLHLFIHKFINRKFIYKMNIRELGTTLTCNNVYPLGFQWLFHPQKSKQPSPLTTRKMRVLSVINPLFALVQTRPRIRFQVNFINITSSFLAMLKRSYGFYYLCRRTNPSYVSGLICIIMQVADTTPPAQYELLICGRLPLSAIAAASSYLLYPNRV